MVTSYFHVLRNSIQVLFDILQYSWGKETFLFMTEHKFSRCMILVATSNFNVKEERKKTSLFRNSIPVHAHLQAVS